MLLMKEFPILAVIRTCSLPGSQAGREMIFLWRRPIWGSWQEAGYVKDLSGVSTVADYTELVQDLMTIDGQISGLGMESRFLVCLRIWIC